MKRRKLSLRNKLRSGRSTVGSWITLAHPAIAEILAKLGFDWLVVDMEHSVITIRDAEELIRVIDLCGVSPLVRLSANDPVQIKRVMDAGAHGIIVPMVNSRRQAEQAVSALRYPPHGQRGVGLARAQGYGTRFHEYYRWLAREGVVIVQVEHAEAVKHFRDIMSVEGVDGYLLGPYDLSASLGVPGDFKHPKMLAALNEVSRVSKSLNVPGGIHVIQPDPKEARRRLRQGFRFLAYSMDILLLGTTAAQGLSAIRRGF